MPVTKRSRTRLLIRLALGLLLALTLAAVAAPFFGLHVRQVFDWRLWGGDYAWLRRDLAQASRAADVAFEDVRRNGAIAGNQAAALALEQAIRYSRGSVRRTGTKPIPPEIRAQMEGFFPDEVLDRVRWAFPNSDLELGSVAAWYQKEGGAVTLQETMVFSTRHAVGNRYLWAHELTHVLQYDALGLRDFTRVYLTNSAMLERQAWDNARRITAELQRRERAAAAQGNASAG